jgi:PadR family transcriptional regulator AphA
MSLRFALLGLLAVQPASGYDLKRAINRSTYFIWNATGPQIYTTLHNLREEGYITSKSLPQQGKPDKYIHTITAGGRAALKEFMGKPIRASVTRDEVLLRIFFGNFANKRTMRRELEAYLARIGKERATMEATEARINANPGGKHEARRYQLLSLRIKVGQIRAMEQELTRFLTEPARARPRRARAGAPTQIGRRGGRPASRPAQPSISLAR